MSWCSSSILLWKIILVSVLTQHSLGYDIYGENTREGFIPLSRLLRNGFWDFLEKMRGGYMVPYPRIGRELVDKRQNMIPLPRIGRDLLDEESTLVSEFLPNLQTLINAVQQQLMANNVLHTANMVSKKAMLKHGLETFDEEVSEDFYDTSNLHNLHIPENAEDLHRQIFSDYAKPSNENLLNDNIFYGKYFNQMKHLLAPDINAYEEDSSHNNGDVKLFLDDYVIKVIPAEI
ncbi:uncharacterized protein LOC118198299 isoform X2 [Stegodyphus dumicola]|uniref:uncharacterized protein LOC118198299 isoform X2 n=1 Tax=Stegodyphus dumicola TaxID=202533 RepID=UPI0015A938E7|nr:uncharacterized protein LOC118198299 isoform X2 [Stegodyphus dumicola]